MSIALIVRSTCRIGVCLLAVLTGVARAADLEPEWVANLPVGFSLSAGLQGMVVDAAGVSYVTGITGPSSNTDVVTAAFDADGALLWSDTWNGPANWHDQARGLTLGPGGVLYVTGNTPGPGNYANVLLLEYDAATGELLDTVQYSSAPFTSEYGASLATDANGNVYVAGGTVGDGGDALLLKFDTAGQFQWKRVWDGPAFGPFSQDNALQMQVDPSGDPIALIHGVMGSSQPDYVVLKLSAADGSTQWQANWGTSAGEYARDMLIDSSGDVYVTGTALEFVDRFGTIKLRGSDGQLLWQAYDGVGLDDGASALALDGQGGVIITGSVDPDGDVSNFNDNIYTVKRDAADGTFRWSHLYGANCVGCLDVPADVLVDPEGRVFVAGQTSSPPYSNDAITLVLDADTGLETDRGILSGGPNQTAGAGVLRFDASYNLYDGGRFYNVNTGAVEITVFKYASLMIGGGGFLDLGFGLAGTSGVPQLAGDGSLQGGEPVTFGLSNALPSGTTTLVLGVSLLQAPFKGGTLVPAPDVLVGGLPIDGTGALDITVTWPALPSGAALYLQYWIPDQGGPFGFAASNGLSVTQP